MIYGDFKSNIVSENTKANPKEIYGTMKLAGEVITTGLCGYYNIDYTSIRPSAVYGPTDMNQRVSQIFIEKAIKGEKIFIQGKDEKLDFTYIQDLVNGVILASTNKKGANETFNITNGKGRTLFEFVKILKNYFSDLEYEVVERDSFRPKRGTLSIKKAKNLLGYNPKFTIEKGIKNYLNYLKDINAFK
jgi:nucleoside-diphosphate-sugar epimerase